MIRAFQWDLARQVERLDWLIAQLPRYAEWGYQELYLHLEDAVEYPSLPGVARADAYSYRAFDTLVGAATRAGIKVVPIVNLLGHTDYLVKVPELRDLNELRAPDGSPLPRGQICPLHPRTLEVTEKLLRDVAPFCTAGKVHVGLDESFHLGRHPLSRAEIAERGLAYHFSGYVGRLRELTRSLGLRMGMWADMLCFMPEAIPLLPRDLIAYDWYYYPFRRLPRMELFNFAEYDLATPLQAHGIEYWGCPMNGAFRYEPMPVFGERVGNIRSWWDRCRRTGAGGFLMTSWEAYRLAIETTTVVDAAAACLWLDPEVDNAVDMLARGFARVFGLAGARERARAALGADERAFAGYVRWQINERWDVFAGRDGVARYEAEERFFGRLETRGALPAPFAASVAFRRYLARRDVFVRRAARSVFRLRRLHSHATPAKAREAASLLRRLKKEAVEFAVAWKAGQKAARAMWARTRQRGVRGQNETILAADARRLRGWRQWLTRAERRPDAVWEATPVCGAWQLQFIVHNFAPAVQKVVVEQHAATGDWEELHGSYLIEFRAHAARPRTKIRHELTVPVPDAAGSYRIAVKGVGQVAIAQVALTDGVRTLVPRHWPRARKRVVGHAAPREGFPAVDWDAVADSVELRFD